MVAGSFVLSLVKLYRQVSNTAPETSSLPHEGGMTCVLYTISSLKARVSPHHSSRQAFRTAASLTRSKRYMFARCTLTYPNHLSLSLAVCLALIVLHQASPWATRECRDPSFPVCSLFRHCPLETTRLHPSPTYWLQPLTCPFGLRRTGLSLRQRRVLGTCRPACNTLYGAACPCNRR